MRTGSPATVAFLPLYRHLLALACLVLLACTAAAAPTSALRFKRQLAQAIDDM
jgi:outer membrane biogenesis lipoprotein LolB